jgi:hypothetical protein
MIPWKRIPLYAALVIVNGSLPLLKAQADGAAEFHPHRLIIKFKPASRMLTRSGSGWDQAQMSRLQRLLPLKLDAVNRLKPLPGGVERIFVAELADGADLEEVLRDFAANPDVEYAERDYIGHGDGKGQPAAGAGNRARLLPGDPDFYWQWGLQNVGQASGRPGIDVNALTAWDITTGDRNTILAVLDSGINQSAPDFEDRILPGYDFVNNDSDPSDDLGHGTNVTSIAAASGGNGIGMAGMNWRCRILPIKILNSSNSGSYSWFASGFIYAADHGAKVINISAGGSGVSQALADAVLYAQSSGAVVVACMMNTNNETPFYPAANAGVIAVGGINNRGERAVPFCYSSTSGSNYGNHIAFVAPGNNILGLNYRDPTQTGYWCGTSQATPFVSGLVTLMFALNPGLSAAQVLDAIKAGARDQIGAANEDTPGWDKYFGWGLIDSFKSLAAVAGGANSFAQVAVGGGYSTVFTFLNTGAETTSGSLILTDNAGEPLNASLSSPGQAGTIATAFPINIPPGGSQTISAGEAIPGDAARAGFARVTSSGGSFSGVATFQLADHGSLATVVGVLSSDTTEAATIPVDDDRTLSGGGRATGYAVANPGSESINIKVTLLHPDGSPGISLDPPDLNPLGPGRHVSRFLWEDLNDPALRFTGSMVLTAQAGKKFSVAALVLNQGLYTAIPVIPGKAPGGSPPGGDARGANLFAQVAVGGGYTTIFTLLNTGANTAAGNLTLKDDGGNPLSASLTSPGLPGLVASSFPVSVPSGGVQFITAGALSPSDGARTGWAQVQTSSGALGGVATFRFVEGGTLTSVVGILSAAATATATIPVDDDRTLGVRSRITGYAVANPGSEGINVRLILVKPDGTVLRTLDPKALNPLDPGSHVARFLWEDLEDPNLQFKGSLVLIIQGGKTASIVALMLNQGLYTAIPVIPAKAPDIK